MKHIMIVDDFIGKSYQESIKKLFFADNFPWYFTPNVTYGEAADIYDENNSPAAYHLFRFDNRSTSQFFQFFLPMVYTACDLCDYQYNDVVKCRSFLQYPLNESFIKNKTDDLHVDLTFDHLVLLYYVLDSDGDTIIVDKTFSEDEVEIDRRSTSHNILEKITPKQGRAVIFNGRYYHTAEQPKTKLRCIINFDII